MTDRLATPDEAREAREIADAVSRCRAVMIDMTPDMKAVVVQDFTAGWSWKRRAPIPRTGPSGGIETYLSGGGSCHPRRAHADL